MDSKGGMGILGAEEKLVVEGVNSVRSIPKTLSDMKWSPTPPLPPFSLSYFFPLHPSLAPFSPLVGYTSRASHTAVQECHPRSPQWCVMALVLI